MLSKYYIFLRPQELPNDRKNTFSLTPSQRLGSKSCSCHHLGLVPFCASVSPVKVKVTQSYPTVGNPTDYIVPVILQARILEWVAIPFSKGSSQPRD